jgi:hypothetical protein
MDEETLSSNALNEEETDLPLPTEIDRITALERRLIRCEKGMKANRAFAVLAFVASPIILPWLLFELSNVSFNFYGFQGTLNSRKFEITNEMKMYTMILGLGGLGVLSKEKVEKLLVK